MVCFSKNQVFSIMHADKSSFLSQSFYFILHKPADHVHYYYRYNLLLVASHDTAMADVYMVVWFLGISFLLVLFMLLRRYQSSLRFLQCGLIIHRVLAFMYNFHAVKPLNCNL